LTKKKAIPYSERIGEKHNMLTIIAITGKENTGRHVKVRCLVECECGTRKDVRIEGIVNGQQYSCGCTRKKFESPYRKLYTNYKNSAFGRGYAFKLTQEQFDRIITKECHYCGTEHANGIDRKINTIGYELENCLPCCMVCNRAKNSMPYEDFITWIERLVKWRS